MKSLNAIKVLFHLGKAPIPPSCSGRRRRVRFQAGLPAMVIKRRLRTCTVNVSIFMNGTFDHFNKQFDEQNGF